MKILVKTLTLTFIGTLVMTSCSNSKATSSATTTTKSKTTYEAKTEETNTKKAVKINSDDKRIRKIVPTANKKSISVKKTVQNKARK